MILRRPNGGCSANAGEVLDDLSAELELLADQVRGFVEERIADLKAELLKRIEDIEAKVLLLEQMRKLEERWSTTKS